MTDESTTSEPSESGGPLATPNAPSPHPRRRFLSPKIFGCVGALLLFVGGPALGLVLFEEELGQRVVAWAARERGFDCGSSLPFEIRTGEDGAWPESVVWQIGPGQCATESSAVRSIRFDEGLDVELDAKYQLARVTAPTLAVELSPQKAPRSRGWKGALSKVIAVKGTVDRLMVDAAQFAEQRWPEVVVDDLTFSRKDRPQAELRNVRLSPTDGGYRISARRAAIATKAKGKLQPRKKWLEGESLKGRITSSRVSLRGRVDLKTSVLGVSVAQNVEFELVVDGLDKGRPSYRLQR